MNNGFIGFLSIFIHSFSVLRQKKILATSRDFLKRPLNLVDLWCIQFWGVLIWSIFLRLNGHEMNRRRRCQSDQTSITFELFLYWNLVTLRWQKKEQNFLTMAKAKNYNLLFLDSFIMCEFVESYNNNNECILLFHFEVIFSIRVDFYLVFEYTKP